MSALYRKRLLVNRFNLAMSLATIDEIKIYGRTLMPYERFAENMLGRLRRMLGQP